MPNAPSPFAIEPLEARQHFASGFTATYFPTTTFSGKAVTRLDATLTGRQSVPAGVNAQSYTARFTANLNPIAYGRHALYISTEGGVRVWSADRLILNKPAAPGVVTHYKMVFEESAGSPDPVMIEYRHTGKTKPYLAAAWVQPGADKVALAGRDVSARPMGLQDQINHGLSFAADQLINTNRSLSPKKGVPIRSEPANPAWQIAPFTDWTSGTLAGSMWELNHHFDGWDALAGPWSQPLADVKIAGDAFDREWAAFKPAFDYSEVPAVKAQAREILLASAARKMATWNATVGAFQTPELVSTSGNPKANFGVLMDQTNDMELLLWAGRETGNDKYASRVLTHMRTVAKYMVRPDGSVVQRGYFDSATGKFIVGENAQGYSNSSTWSRGQAWAMLSFATVGEGLGDYAGLLQVAKKVADYYINNTPADGVPYWDYQSPDIPKTSRDTSAAAIAAKALMTLSYTFGYPERDNYQAYAGKIIGSLLSPTYSTEGTNLKGLMRHGAANVPRGKGVDADLMFGDYYLLRAMNAYTGH